jgi:hypothetical protein
LGPVIGAIPLKELSIDVQLECRQRAYFMTNQYVLDFQEQSPIPDNLFPGAKIVQINRGRGWDDTNGWNINKDNKDRQFYRIPTRNPQLIIDMKPLDTGPVNGPTGHQEFIKSLYIATSLLVTQTGGEDLG